MHMIPIAVEVLQGRVEVLAHVGKDGPQVLQDRFREDQLPILGGPRPPRFRGPRVEEQKALMTVRDRLAGR